MAGSPIRPICRPICTPIIRGINTLVGNSAFSPLSVFSGGKVGALYDSKGWQNTSSPTGLWQDSGRTTPVTALGQPVGAIDDSSGNATHLLQATGNLRGTFSGTPATFGSDVVTNGNFATDTVWTKGAGWTIAGNLATGAAASSDLSEPVTLSAGEWAITYTVSGFVAGTVQAKLSGTTDSFFPSRFADGTYTDVARFETGNNTLTFVGSGATLSLSNVSLKKINTYSAPYGVRFDGVGNVYQQAGTFVMPIPCYAITAARRVVSQSTSAGFFSAFQDASNQFTILSLNTASAQTRFRSTARGLVSTTGVAAQWVDGVSAVIDALNIVGTTDNQINNNTVVTIANTWTSPDTLATAKMGTTGVSGLAPAMAYMWFGGLLVGANPGTNRAKLKTYFGAVAGLTL